MAALAATSSEGVRRSWRSARRASAGSLSAATRGAKAAAVHILPGLVPEGRTRAASCCGAPRRAGRALIAAPAAHAGLFFPESGGSPNADSIQTLYMMVFVLALFIFVGVEGALIYSLFKYRARKGRDGRADPRQHAAGDRLDGRRGRDPHLHHGLHVHQAAGDQEPEAVADRRQRPAGRDADGTLFAATDQPAPPRAPTLKIARQRPAVRVALPATPARTSLLAYADMVVPGRHDRHAGHHGRRRRPLLVDPEARRQDGRRPGLRQQDLVPDPAGRHPGRARSRWSTTASAPSCAAATTRTCTAA